jgi:imidazole glycerol-phosphate synthase subunit HisH
MITLVDYGMGNISSVRNALDFLGEESELTADPLRILQANKILLPGVGAFPKAMQRLNELGLVSALREKVLDKNTPCFGICLGMQLLGEWSEENEMTEGLGLIPGIVRNISTIDPNVKVPHVGFNSVDYHMSSLLFDGIKSGSDFYFVHSYSFHCENNLHQVAVAGYDNMKITAAIQCNNVIGVQFHPEKSQANGLKLLQNFINL